MSRDPRDRELGMYRKITRRDFMNGVALVVGASIAPPGYLRAQDKGPDVSGRDPLLEQGITPADPRYDPPAQIGLRGNHAGSFEIAHQLRDGAFWDSAGEPENTGEKYDLVIVGGGISGLAAAYFYRRHAGPHARILILENHDDFGGHAKRNEFQVGKRLLLSNGGTQSIDTPGGYSAVAKGLLRELGVDTRRFFKAYDRKLYSNLGTACFFNRETFGDDRLVTGMGTTPWRDFLAKSPLSEIARRDIERVYTEKRDYLPGLSRHEKWARLAKISYSDFLTKLCHVHPDALPFFQTYPADLFGVGIDAISALTCYFEGDDYGSFTYAGFDGMGLGEMGEEEPYIFHFPDGNASIARLLVRSLIPGSVPGQTMEDVVTAHVDYSRLDVEGTRVRIRLNSTAVRVRHVGPLQSSQEVELAYVRDRKLQTLEAKSCVLACYNMMIPHLCPELPEKQQEALHLGVKVPYLYTHVAIRNWTVFQKLGIHQIVAPAGYHTYVALDFPVSLGEYKFPGDPNEPMVLFMMRSPCVPGIPRRDQYRQGRGELYSTHFSVIERNIRDQLQRMLGPAGFDPARDIAAITVNRWAHGYAYEYESLSDPHVPENQRPCAIGRQRFGRISIANSDAAGRAYTDAAIDQAHRAVQEVLRFA
ncbi:MAG TPA: NAD(P)-binding protein [Candidatus Acidoferrales bacterium]|nr:NAD(P)-binding protein [Candidatus Acidoferrales bacterium]